MTCQLVSCERKACLIQVVMKRKMPSDDFDFDFDDDDFLIVKMLNDDQEGAINKNKIESQNSRNKNENSKCIGYYFDVMLGKKINGCIECNHDRACNRPKRSKLK
jgi:hypothetical protein